MFALLLLINGQSKDGILKAVVIEIIEANHYIVTDDSGKEYSVILSDTKLSANETKKNEALKYVKEKIYKKTVYVFIDKQTNSQIYGSLIYECDEVNDNVNDIPCQSANSLDLELIKLGYVTYTGANKFLKQLN
ncbi:MAG: hypothetical protein GX159_05685 [Flavobacteriaceae bacterium]|jgi:hypothetical protein|nr:hypothetical protein [Flavobacteriaceae bacterium]